jgi:TonB family protein
MANKSDKGIKKVSEAFFGSGGGAGGGSGSGAGGGGLKDKSMEGMAGVSGGFGTGTIDPSSVGGGSGRGALQAGGGGSGGGSGAGGRAPYEITGALSGRKIMHQVLPPYPEWAREKGLFALVSIEFSVFHNGQVNVSSMLVKKSSGYIQLDTLVQEALAKWRFEPLDASQYGKEQKGTITFKFRAI